MMRSRILSRIMIIFLVLSTSFVTGQCPCSGRTVCVSSACKKPNDDTVACTSDSECAVGSPRGVCAGNCKCATGYRWTYYYNDCAKPNDNAASSSCSTINDCLDRNTNAAECGSNGRCQCKLSGSISWSGTRIKCGKFNDFTSLCDHNYECYDTPHGNCGGGGPAIDKCRCDGGYLWDSTDMICRAQNDNSKSCLDLMDCYDTSDRGLCNGKCTCASGCTYDTADDTCRAPNNNQFTCRSLTDCKDRGVGAICSVKCTCKPGYMWVDSKNKCLAYNDNSLSCTDINDCYDQRVAGACLGSKCTCETWSSWDATSFFCKRPNDSNEPCTTLTDCVDTSDRALCSTTTPSKCTCCSTCQYDTTSRKCKAPNNGLYSCSSLSDCIHSTSPGACTGGKCQCIADHGWVAGSNKCLPYNVGTYACTATSGCYDQRAGHGICSSLKCTCDSGSSWDPVLLRCKSPNNNMYTCSGNINLCQDSSDRAVCSGNCQCATGCTFDYTAKTCKAPNTGTFSCQSLNDCKDSSPVSAVCSTTCQCNTGYGWDSTVNKCLAYNDNTIACPNGISDCFYRVTNVGDCAGGKCTCATWSSWESTLKKCKGPNNNGYACSSLDYCVDGSDRALCTGGVCTCATGCSYDTTTRKCRAPNNNLFSCTTVSDCKHDAAGGLCSTANKCICDTDYEWVSSASKCRAYNTGALGCPNGISDCFDQTSGTAECTGGKCTCASWSAWEPTLKKCKGPNNGFACSSLDYCVDGSNRAVCTTGGICSCASGCNYDSTTRKCRAPNNNAFDCTSTSDCIDYSAGAVCSAASKCSCATDYVWGSSAQKCLAYNIGTLACTTINQCFDQTSGIAECTGGKCTCASWSAWEPTLKKCKGPNNGIFACSSLDYCIDGSDRAVCSTGGVCTCATGCSYDSTGSRKCLAPNNDAFSCTSTSDCKDSSAAAVCSSAGKCSCATGYVWVSSVQKCLAYNTNTLSCTLLSQCFDQTPGVAECTGGKCTCASWSAWESTLKKCKGPNDNAFACSSLDYCIDGSDRAVCTTGGKCTCATGCQYDSASTKKCKAPNNDAFSCDSVSDCIDSSVAAICSAAHKCSCDTGYVWVSSAQKCLAYNTNTLPCTTLTQCYDQTSGVAECTGGKCTCATWSSWDGGLKKCRGPNDGVFACTALNYCADYSDRALCGSGKCKCEATCTYDSTNKKCLAPNNAGFSCAAVTDCIDSTSGAICSTAGKCDCDTDYEWVTASHHCLAYNIGSLSCTALSDCYDRNTITAACTGNKCVCATWSSWDTTLHKCRGPNDGTFACTALNYCADQSDRATCTGGFCSCCSTCQYDTTGKKCKAPNDGGFSCSAVADCIDSTASGACTASKCDCATGYGWVPSANKCLAYNDGSLSCTSISSCYDQTTGVSACDSSKCTCAAGSTWESSLGRCTVPNDGTFPCSSLTLCQDTNPITAECNVECHCKSPYVWDTVRHKCLGPNDGNTGCVGGTTSLCMDQSANAVCNAGVCGCAANYAWDGTSKTCVCAAGTYLNGGTCTPCAQGSYQPLIGQSSCNLCSAGTANAATGSTSATACADCLAGTYAAAGSATCSACGVDTYQNLARQGSCVACPANSTTNSATGASICTCDAHYFYSGNFPNYCEGTFLRCAFSHIAIECHEYCDTCATSSTNCSQCIIHAGIEHVAATNRCRCKTDTLYREKLNILGKHECYLCAGCPNMFSSAVLSNEWTKVEITFAQNVIPPYGGTDGTASMCNATFTEDTLRLLGTGYTCSMIGPKIVVNMGENADFSPSSTLIPKGNTLFITTCNCPYEVVINMTSVDPVTFGFNAATTPPSPVVSCAPVNMTLSGFQGAGNRPKYLRATYAVERAYSTDSSSVRAEAFAQSVTKINAYLATVHGVNIRIPAGMLLENAGYVVNVDLTTYLGSSASQFTISTSDPVTPTLSLNTVSSIGIHDWQNVAVVPTLVSPACPSTGFTRYHFTWLQFNNGAFDLMGNSTLEQSYSNTTGALNLAPFTLLPEFTYALYLTAAHMDYPISARSDIITIRVVSSQLVAQISGGDRSLATNETLLLDGSTSEDRMLFFFGHPWIGTSQGGDISYSWKCENITVSSAATSCVFLNKTQVKTLIGARLTFVGGTFYPGSAMKWTLSISKGSAFHSTFVQIKIVPESGVMVGIKTSKEGLKVNRNKLVILSASVYSTTPYALKYSWRSEPVLPKEVYAAGTNEKFLKILPYSLDESVRYIFTCTVTDADGSTGDSVIRVIVNRAPRNGDLTVTPSSGYPGSTIFTFKATSWIDEDTPLAYLFSYFDQSTGLYVPFSSRTASPSLSSAVLAPVGPVKIKLEVFDNFNASTVVYGTVTLERSTGSGTDYLAAANDPSKTGYQRLQAISYAAKSLNCTTNSSTECAQAVEVLRGLESGLNKVSSSPEVDATILGVLNSTVAVQGDHLNVAMDVLGKIVYRENATIGSSLSIYDDQFEGKKVQTGLTTAGAALMGQVAGKMLKQMTDTQIYVKQQTILDAADIIGRSLIKDSVPNEKPVVLQTEGFSMVAQKVSTCGNSGLDTISNGEVKGVGYAIPICDILALNQTTFPNKTLNRVKPYDVIVQAFERNVVGDCTPLPTKLLRVMIYDDSQKIQYSVRQILRGINFTFDLDPIFPEDELSKVSCVYYEESNVDFTPETLTTTLIDIDKKRFRCSSTHLTEFTLMYLPFVSDKDFINAEFWVLVALLTICIGMHAWATYCDGKDRIDVIAFLNEKTAFYKSRTIVVMPAAEGNSRPSTPPEISVSTYMPFDQSRNVVPAPDKTTTEGPDSPTKLVKPEGYDTIPGLTVKMIAMIILVFFWQRVKRHQ